MRPFFQEVDLRGRKAMVGFLQGHFRYFTMNSWNRSTSYANCVKLPGLGLMPTQIDRAWKMLDCEQVFDVLHEIIRDWSSDHAWRWQVAFNGRSGGYLVLYQGGLDYKNAHTARCDTCGRSTRHKRETPCTGAGCEGTLRVLSEPQPQTVTYPGRGLDQDEAFEDWDIVSLRDRVRVVQEFDRLCDEVLQAFVGFCNHYEVVEEDILVPKTVSVLKPA